MKLTGELKEKVEKTETKEEAKKTIEDAGFILNDAELDQVAGGDGGFIDWLSDSLENKITTVEKPKFQH